MRTNLTETPPASDVHRHRCYACFRPQSDCFCDTIPSIDNQMDVLILQHTRERFHAFNTARIVRKALRNSHLLVGHAQELAAMRLPLRPRAGLLYPGPEAQLISEVSPDQYPDQLVILDGTWHHAKTLFRDIPALHNLPRFRLAPERPGRYRIRREPNATSLSTLEAAVAALRGFEPTTPGLDQLLTAFETMVDRQLAHAKSQFGWRKNERRTQGGTNIPRALVGDLANVVVAYGESAPGQRGDRRRSQPPVYWAAQRLGTDQRCAFALQPATALSETALSHLELTDRDFANALSPEEFRCAWAQFLRTDDVLVVYHQSTLRLLQHVHGSIGKSLVLKSVAFNSEGTSGTLETRLAAEGLSGDPAQHPGRAGKRVAQAIALVRHLNAVGNTAVASQ